MGKGQENHPNEEKVRETKNHGRKGFGAEREEVVWDGLLWGNKKIKLNINLKIYHKTRTLNSQLNRDYNSAIDSLIHHQVGVEVISVQSVVKNLLRVKHVWAHLTNSWGNTASNFFVLKVRRGTLRVIPYPSRRIQADWAWPHDREGGMWKRPQLYVCC